jgi:hypothetical protein
MFQGFNCNEKHLDDIINIMAEIKVGDDKKQNDISNVK